METKFCICCEKEKFLFEFIKDKTRKDGYFPYCKECKNHYRNKEKDYQYVKNYRKNNRFCRVLESIKRRCENPKCPRYKNYGGRGIKCLITKEEIKELWFRDKAFEMKKPSIDRKDNDGNYTFDNCQFLEYDVNSRKNRIKPIIQFDLNGVFIREWESITLASKTLAIFNISNVLLGKRKSVGGFRWKYK